ncbi:MAG TPA: type II toxin-antitoxin system RelE/ParE family toxin [Fastidiosipila sp.]|nr:type II toxin-antitoxin system RelE/ParE family toxin [Fastidiosipila sp.]
MTKCEIIFYEKDNGEVPVEKFLNGLELKKRAKTMRTIDLLQNNGWKLRSPYSKELSDGIFELRTQFGSDITRVFYFFVIGKQAVLTHGFVKKSVKTPPEEIERAKRYRQDYLRRQWKDRNGY